MLISALALVFAQDPLAKPITLSAKVGSAAFVVAELSKASGVSLKASSVVESEIVGLATPERPLKDAMDALAKAMDAGWKKEGEVYVLTRTNEQENQRKARDRAERLAKLRKSMEKLSKKPTDTFDAAAAKKLASDQKEAQKYAESNPQEWSRRYRDLIGKSPIERLVRRIAAQLKPEDLVDLVPGQRIVVATNPTAMQVRFPSDPTAFVNQFLADQAVWAEAIRPEGSEENQINYFGGPTQKIEKIGKVLMTVSRQEMWGDGGVTISVKVMDPKGRMAAEGQQNFGGMFSEEDSGDFMKAAQPEPNDEIIEQSGVAASFTNYIRSMQASNGREKAAPDDVQAYLKRPDLNEPLGMAVESPLNTIATKKNQVAAAVLPDASFMAIMFGAAASKLPLSRWYKTMAMLGLEKMDDGKSVVLRPETPIQVEESRTNRKALAVLLARNEKEGRVSLDAAAEFIKQTRMDSSTLAMMYVFFLRLEGLQVASNPGQVQYVRLYGSLNNNQRELLKKGGELSLTQMDAGQRDILRKIVYWSDNRYGNMMGEEDFEAPEPDENGQIEYGPYGDWGSLKHEPTERFPNGLPPETVLTATVTEKTSYFRSGDENMYMQGPIEEHQLAWEMYQRERLDLFPYAKNQPEIKEVRQGKASSWDFALKLAPKFSMRQTLRDDVIGKEKIAIKDLPKDFMEKIQKQMKEYREAYKDSKPGDFGGQGRGQVIPPLR